MRLAGRLAGVAPPATLVLAEKARQLAAAGRDVVSLTAGEPDFDPPAHAVEAMVDALRRGRTRYTAVAGVAELREAVVALHRARGRAYAPEQVVASTGAKQCLFNAFMALLDPGDEAVIVAPYWLSYVDMIRLAGGREVVVPTSAERGFVPRAADLAAAMGPRTRALVLNSPSNPAGALLSRDDLLEIAAVVRARPDVTVISDDIYERFVFDGARSVSILDVAPDLVDRTLSVSGCSKTFAMTGLRLGWAVGPRPLVEAMTTLQGQSTSNACTPVQLGAVAALTGDQGPVDRMVAAFEARRRRVVDALRAIPGLRCVEPRGAFYALPDASAFLGRRTPGGLVVEDAVSLARHLLEGHGLAVVPGEPFGAPGHVRLSFATDLASLDRGLERLAAGLAALA